MTAVISEALASDPNFEAFNHVAEANYIEPPNNGIYWCARFTLHSGEVVEGFGVTAVLAGADALRLVAERFAA